MAAKRPQLARRRKSAGYSQERLAQRLGIERSTVVRWEAGETEPQPWIRPKLAAALAITVDDLRALIEDVVLPTEPSDRIGDLGLGAEEIEAQELVRCASASNVGAATVERIELAVDDFAIAYPGTAPVELLPRVRQHLRYVVGLLDSRMTLAEHRRLLVAGGWLSLLAATCAIDLDDRPVAAARLRTAADMARETEHSELAAWCLETAAWQTLTDGDYQRAVELARQAQHTAPRDGSARIQATAQEGRAWARLGAQPETRDALSRVEKAVSSLPMPNRPEHHYQYDPAKAEAYFATTLSWSGDPAAEHYAREVLARLDRGAGGGPPRPRRAASARLDLALALIASEKLDEAAGTALEAVTSGRLVPSNYWRADEVVTAVEDRGVPEAAELKDALADIYRDGTPTAIA